MASAADAALVRGDLCVEAIWLAGLLHELVPDDPAVAGLLALLLLSDARRATRVAADGSPVLLADQDRSQWNQAQIARGLATLTTAFGARSAGPYQIQAAISALHSTAASVEKTNWGRIVKHYDVLATFSPDAVTSLNRAAAIGHRDGPASGLAAIAMLTRVHCDELADYPYLHACRAEFLAQTGDVEAAESAWRRRSLSRRTNRNERTSPGVCVRCDRPDQICDAIVSMRSQRLP